jgi:hypothetical protein
MTVAQLEQYRDIHWLADYLGMSVRWLEYRMKEGMPHHKIGSRTKVRVSECEDWLRKEGWIKEGR